MIAFIQGNLESLTPSNAVIFTGGSIAFDCRISLETYTELKGIYDSPSSASKLCQVYTDLIFRTDAIPVMVCFFREVERKLFRNLMKIPGVGLNMALTIISGLGVDELILLAQTPYEPAFLALKGVGPKMAKQLIFDVEKILVGIADIDIEYLKTVSLKRTSSTIQATSVQLTEAYYDAIEGCKALGMNAKAAKDSVDRGFKANPAATVQELIKASLTSK